MAREDLLEPLLQPAGALRDLLAGYFNQDWGDDHETWEGVVAAFAADGRATGVKDAVSELDWLLASDATDDDVDWVLREGLHSGFVPSRNGMGPRESLQAIRDELNRQLPEGPSGTRRAD
jgi:hypothetical protein